MTEKRAGYLEWDTYFMGVAMLSALRSKDPNTQVGSCIVNPQKRIVGIGYAGFPNGCSDDVFPWAREGAFLETKYPYVCHAELNAILNGNQSNLSGCTVYTTLFPCHECTKAIIQSGISEVVYLSGKYLETESGIAARKMFDAAGVVYRKFEKEVDINLRWQPL